MCCMKRPKHNRIMKKERKNNEVFPVLTRPVDDKFIKTNSTENKHRVIQTAQWKILELENNKVFPILTRPVDGKFIKTFLARVIPCGGCEKVFDLGSDELKIHCNLCEQFFHCKIAGKCRGENCQVMNHSASYCLNCVSKVYNNNECLCKDCFKE